MTPERINLPIHIHEGVENIHVYIANGVIHVKLKIKDVTNEQRRNI
jgi:ribosomal protein S19